jgi:hypothetical protein
VNPGDIIPTDQALRVYPALAGLLAIIGAGWRFHEIRDDDGITALYGNRQYPHMPHVMDAIKIRSEDDARGVRGRRPDGRLWELDGGLTDVVDGLLNLPDPASPLAPSLIVGAAPRLWTP